MQPCVHIIVWKILFCTFFTNDHSRRRRRNQNVTKQFIAPVYLSIHNILTFSSPQEIPLIVYLFFSYQCLSHLVLKLFPPYVSKSLNMFSLNITFAYKFHSKITVMVDTRNSKIQNNFKKKVS